MKRLVILTLCTITVAYLIFIFKKRNPTTIATGEGLVIKKEWLKENKNPLTPLKDIRPGDQTFLTFPEWYLVFSPNEQADYFSKYTSTSFPFMSHVRQFWESYHIVNAQIKGNFPPNPGYHLMIWVIGLSTTIEYSLKGCYETIVGRLTDTHDVVTDEDKFQTKYAQDYVAFIKDKPWYEFNFSSRLKNLWTETSFFGSNFIRKIERKYFLTSELLVKIVYGKLIGIGSQKVYGASLEITAVVINDSCLITLTRYDKFTPQIMALAKKGIGFKEIAGNNSAILLTVLLPTNSNIAFENAQIILKQPIATELTMKRIALAVPVGELAELLKQFDNDKIKVEHVFDY